MNSSILFSLNVRNRFVFSHKKILNRKITRTYIKQDTQHFQVQINKHIQEKSGDATGEMGPFKDFIDGDNTSRYHNSWYGDNSAFVESANPWITRGGQYNNGTLAGEFCFTRNTGAAAVRFSFRVVLT